MKKFLIYGEGLGKPIRKTKHENDAMLFVSDFRNLQQYGYMSIICENDDGKRLQWDADNKVWVVMEEING